MSAPLQPVFDGHNDVLSRLWRQGGDTVRGLLEGNGTGHLDLPRMREGGFVGGFFALYSPTIAGMGPVEAAMAAPAYDIPLPQPLETAPSLRAIVEMTALLLRAERDSRGGLVLCRNAAAVREAVAAGSVAAVLHLEGAEAIGPDLAALEVLHAAGLRSLGPVWSRPNIFGHGVPFRFPSSPDTGPGLTDLGAELVRRCEALGMVIDLSHITEQGFWDVARLTTAPLVATHSNAHVLCPHSRNLTDRQLDAIAERGGVVGLNFATPFLRVDGRRMTATPLDDMLRHLDHLLARLGEGGVALGSDFDGAPIPDEIGTVLGLPNLVHVMRRHGYGPDLVDRIAWTNWLDLLERVEGAAPSGGRGDLGGPAPAA